jgi:hypothetical protein
MYDYLKKQNILSEHQFGFRQFHSTTTTLLDCTNEWYINMDRSLYNIVVLLDLKKAFDTVNHEILLRKFERYGFGNKALDLLSNYLTNRTQRCQLNGMLSDQRGITCGIPQGSTGCIKKKRNLGISQEIDIVLRTKDFRCLGI